MLYEAVKKAERKNPKANIKIVDVDNFYRLLKNKLQSPFESPYSNNDKVSSLPDTNCGLERIDVSDGSVRVLLTNGFLSWQIFSENSVGYLYFSTDKGFKQHLGKNLSIEVEYFDDLEGQLFLEFNSEDESATLAGAYKLHNKQITLTGSKKWKAARFEIEDALFSGRQNGLSDFRFVNLSKKPIVIRKVKVSRKE
jgi:hypothetical protein